jgi:hypothetical protein
MPDESPLPVTERTRHRRLREQGSTDRADLAAILAAGVICHLGVVVDGYPMVVPTVYGLAATWQDPVPDPVLPAGIPPPPHIAARIRRPLG